MSNFTDSNKWQCSLCVDSRQGGRDENQDCYGFKETPHGFLVVVCDGMGGGPAGAYASSIAVQSIVQEVDEAPPSFSPETVLQNAITATNELIRRTVQENRKLMGMGSTCVVALISFDKATVAHVGDSRFYLYRNGKQTFKTADHSVVGEMVRNGELTEEEARRAENSNVITRALGVSDIVEVEIDSVKIKPNDLLALCTDGVWGMLPQQELTDYICQKQPIDSILPNLLNNIELLGRKKPNSSYDNLTLAIVQINRKEKKPQSATPKPATKRPWVKMLLALALILSVGANVYFFMNTDNKKQKPAKQGYAKAEKISQNSDTTSEAEPNDDDLRLQYEFALRRNQDYKDSLERAKKELEQQKSSKHNLTPEQQKLLNSIINKMESLNTGKIATTKNKKKQVAELLKKKSNTHQLIKSEFKKLRNLVKSNEEKWKEIATRLEKNGNTIVKTDTEGASTKDAKEEIDKIVKMLKDLK